MQKNVMEKVAELLGMEIGEEFVIENADRKETVVLAADGLHVVQPNNVLGPDHGKLLSKVLQGLYEVKKKPWDPKEGDAYYYPHVRKRTIMLWPWRSDTLDCALKSLGMIYRSRKEAEANFAKDYEKLTGKKLMEG